MDLKDFNVNNMSPSEMGKWIDKAKEELKSRMKTLSKNDQALVNSIVDPIIEKNDQQTFEKKIAELKIGSMKGLQLEIMLSLV